MNPTIGQTKPKRLYIYTKDIMRITGKGKSSTQELVRTIKKKLNKNPECNLTVIEFCEAQGLKLDEVNLFL
jgi:hypothetical protein